MVWAAASAAAAGLTIRFPTDRQHEDADVVVLMGAVLAGRSAALEDRLPVPILDGMRSGMPLLEAMVRIGARPPVRGSYAFPGGRVSAGLSEELRDRLLQVR
jgi:allantoin racemase